MNKTVDWEELYKQFEKNELYWSFLDNQEAEVREKVQFHLQNPSKEDLKWIKEGLQDSKVKSFISSITAKTPALSDELFYPLMRAAIEEVDPSNNRWFVEPCMMNFEEGPRRVHEYLLGVLETGTPFEQAGAVNAMYWATVKPDQKYPGSEEMTKRTRLLLLEQFVKSKSVDVQRSIIPTLNLNEENYPESHKPLVQKAITIAQSHPDEYIQNRLGVQLGTESILRALPHRKRKRSLREKIQKRFRK